MSVHELRVIPLPSEELSRSDAIAWLADTLPHYLYILENGLTCPDGEIRGAVCWLVHDLQEMARACGEAIRAEGITTLVEEAISDMHDGGTLNAVPLILAAQQWGEGTNDEMQRVYGGIAVQLAKRLAEGS